jgi:hypothetical protein
MSIVFLVILGVWLILSILAPFSSFRWMGWMRWLKEKDEFSLIPCWTFFSCPGADSLHLLYRDKLVDGRFTPWREVALCNTSPWRVLWNPKRRQRKALETLCVSLLDLVDYFPKRKRLLISSTYLLILTCIMTQPHQNESDSRQFLLACTHGAHSSQDAEILFLSPMHRF